MSWRHGDRETRRWGATSPSPLSLLSKENLQNLKEILSEIKMLTKDVREQLQGFQRLVDNGVAMEKRITAAFEKVETASLSVKKMTDSLENNYVDVGRNMSRDVRQGLEYFNQLLYELTILAGDIQRTIRVIEASPSDLLFKQTRPKPGPGEAGYNEK